MRAKALHLDVAVSDRAHGDCKSRGQKRGQHPSMLAPSVSLTAEARLARERGAVAAADADVALGRLLRGLALVAGAKGVTDGGLRVQVPIESNNWGQHRDGRRIGGGNAATRVLHSGGGALRKSASRHAAHGENGGNDQKFLHDKHPSFFYRGVERME